MSVTVVEKKLKSMTIADRFLEVWGNWKPNWFEPSLLARVCAFESRHFLIIW